MARVRVGTAVAVLAAALAGLCAGAAASAGGLDRAVTHAGTPTGGNFATQVDVGAGRKLYLRCQGTGSPTVILESGIHDSSDPWNLTDTQAPVLASPAVFPGVAKFTRVCEYDRPGTLRYTNPGAVTTRSTPVAMPRRLPSMVADLHALLTKARVHGPYLLVAHSYGGLIARLFAQTYPSASAGLVLVDALGTDIKARFGAQWPAYETLLNQPGSPFDQQRGFETVDTDGALQAVENGPAFPTIPVAVISKTEPFATAPGAPAALTTQLELVWPEVQNTLVSLQPQTPHIFATGSDHYVQIRDPDLTLSTIKLVLQRVRGR
jgi:pimeloyl-ACP methyl ester carboxylesterase